MRERYRNRYVTAVKSRRYRRIISPCNTAQYKFANAPRVWFIIQRRHIGATILSRSGALHRPLTRRRRCSLLTLRRKESSYLADKITRRLQIKSREKLLGGKKEAKTRLPMHRSFILLIFILLNEINYEKKRTKIQRSAFFRETSRRSPFSESESFQLNLKVNFLQQKFIQWKFLDRRRNFYWWSWILWDVSLARKPWDSKAIDTIRPRLKYVPRRILKLAQLFGYSLMNFTFFGCLVRGLPLPLDFLNGALFRLCPASEIQTRSKHSKRFRGGD